VRLWPPSSASPSSSVCGLVGVQLLRAEAAVVLLRHHRPALQLHRVRQLQVVHHGTAPVGVVVPGRRLLHFLGSKAFCTSLLMVSPSHTLPSLRGLRCILQLSTCLSPRTARGGTMSAASLPGPW
jgi:hypothetical protein